jgi:hypothetical protein
MAVTPNEALRETFFGDLPLAAWAGSGAGEPWARFKLAAARFAKGDRDRALAALGAILKKPDLESRHYLEAWTALRDAGIEPPAHEARKVLGVVIDVPVEGGFDTLAAYADWHARYLNHSGAGIVWDARDTRMDTLIKQLLVAGQALANQIGPWSGARPSLVSGRTRISLLAPCGLLFGEGPFQAFMQDPHAAPILTAGTSLMRALVDLHGRSASG